MAIAILLFILGTVFLFTYVLAGEFMWYCFAVKLPGTRHSDAVKLKEAEKQYKAQIANDMILQYMESKRVKK